MMLRNRLLIAITATLLVSCSDITSTNDEFLLGSWRTTEPTLPSGEFKHTFTFAAGGHFTWRTEIYGMADNPRSLLSYSESRGYFISADGKLWVTILEVESWDKWFSNTVQTTTAFYPLFDGSSFEITGPRVAPRLTLRYLSYPADAPIPSEMQLERLR